MRRRIAWLMAISVLLGLLGVYWRPTTPVIAPAGRADAPGIGTHPAGDSPLPAPELAAPAAAVDLPATTTTPRIQPVLSTLQALDARSRAGDAAATIELMREAQRCLFALRVDRLREQFDALQRYGNVPSTFNVYRNQQSLEQSLAIWTDERESQRCAGVPIEWLDQEFDWLLRLAEQGDLAAQLRFVLDPPLSRRTALADIDRIGRYRQRAPALLQRAFEQGSVDALVALLDQQAPVAGRVGFGGQFSLQSGAGKADTPLLELPRHLRMSSIPIPPVHRQLPITADPVRALALAGLCLRVCTDSDWLVHAQTVIDRFNADLDSSERLQAGSLAQRWQLQHFSRIAPRHVLNWSARWQR